MRTKNSPQAPAAGRAARVPAYARPGRCLLAMLLCAAAHAQAATYRWIDADGRVVYGDRPPAADATPLSATGSDPATLAPALPHALRTVAARRPVTLYTIRDCEPCDAARAHLARRGVPYAERTLVRDADVAAFRALGFGDLRLPAIAVGADRSQPFAPQAWESLLDAAGYPKESMLPRGWRAAPARPLAADAAQAAEPAAGNPPRDDGARVGAPDGDEGAASEAASAPLPERAFARPVPVRRTLPATAPVTSPAPAGSAIRF